jgi:hypothetical protein
VDFVGPLPESSNLNGTFDMIMLAICHLTSLVHLIPTKQTYRAKDIAEVMFDRIYKHHGLPKNIVSDRDTLFTSTFWQKLNKLTGVELWMSSLFHPESDGTSERGNRTMTQMLRQCISPDQKDWVSKLPAIEFAMNSASSATTRYAPFVLNYGRMPQSMVWNSNSEFPGVRIFAQKIKDAVLIAHDSILEAHIKQTRLANRHRKEAPFTKGDLVYLSTKNLSIPKGHARKLAPKFIGRYQILEDYKNDTFKLNLSPELKQHGLHPSFHVHLLRIHIPNDDRRFPGRQMGQLSSLGNAEEWAVAGIATHHGKGTGALFEVTWKAGDKAWLPYQEISHLEALTQYLEAQGVDSIEKLPRRISAEPGLPLSYIDLRYRETWENKFENTLERGLGSSHAPHAHGTLLGKQKYKIKADDGETVQTLTPHCSMTSYLNKFSELDLETFSRFSAFVSRGEYRPNQVIPTGYAEFAVDHQFDVNPPALPEGASVRTLFIDGRNTVVIVPTSHVPPPLGRNARQFEGQNSGFSQFSQKGKSNPKQRFDFDRANANAKADLKAQTKAGERYPCIACRLSNSHTPAKQDDSFNSLKARNAELLDMLSNVQDASEDFRARSLAIPSQEAQFGN